MKLDIIPYHRVGPLQFGMSCQEVRQALGNIDRIIKGADGITELHNFKLDVLAQVLTDSDRLIEVGFGHHAKNVSFGAVEFFKQSPSDVLAALCRIDSTAVAGYGSILFPTLGLSLTGFLGGDDDDSRAMSVFETGRCDDLVPIMKPFRL